MTHTIEQISTSSLVKDPNHPRTDNGDLTELKLTIEADGIINPIIVIKAEDGTPRVIDGWRRVEALKELGKETISCLVSSDTYNAAEAAHQSYITNEQRNPLNPIDKAKHIKKMLDEFHYTLEQMELKGYGSKSELSKLLSHLTLPNEIQQMMIDGKISKSHAEHISKLETPEEQSNMSKKIVKEGMSVRATEKYVKRCKNEVKEEPVIEETEAKSDKPDNLLKGIYWDSPEKMKDVEDGSVALIFTTLPDGDDIPEHHRKKPEQYTESVLDECASVLMPGGVIAFPLGAYNGSEFHFIQRLERQKVSLEDEIICIKKSYPGNSEERKRKKISRLHQRILIFRKAGERAASVENESYDVEQLFSSIWDFSSSDGKFEDIMATEAAERIIRMYSDIGNTVLDPFLKKGDTVRIARELNRTAVGYESNMKYFQHHIATFQNSNSTANQSSDIVEDSSEFKKAS